MPITGGLRTLKKTENRILAVRKKQKKSEKRQATIAKVKAFLKRKKVA